MNKYIKCYESYFKSIITIKDNSVIKEFNDEYELSNTIKYFPKYPNLFPIIYSITDNKIELEKLDTKIAEKEFKMLNRWFKKNLKISFGSYLMRNYTFKLIYPNKPFPKLPQDFPEEYKLILNKYQSLVNDIMIVVGKHFLLDVHAENFGYDKNGILKMFDI